MRMEPFTTTKAVCVATLLSGAVIAQVPEVPISDWARLSVSASCLAILGYVIIVTIPRMFDAQIKAQADAAARDDARIERIVIANRERDNILARKLDYQTDTIIRLHTGQKLLPKPGESHEH